MQYIELQIQNPPEYTEIIIAELGEYAYESFLENETGVHAYIQQEFFDEKEISTLVEKYKDLFDIRYKIEILAKENWNEEWEKNYEPIIVLDQCLIKSSFHQIEKEFPYQITINPKMSFGTGHHETTTLMIENQLGIDFKDKTVLDAGSGTGILAIFASLLGSKFVDAYDIEDWAYANAVENVELNHRDNVKIQLGTIHTVQLSEKYDVILANINKNVLLDEIPEYCKYLNPKSVLIVSGFYREDAAAIEEISAKQGLIKITQKERNNWLSIVFQSKA